MNRKNSHHHRAASFYHCCVILAVGVFTAKMNMKLRREIKKRKSRALRMLSRVKGAEDGAAHHQPIFRFPATKRHRRHQAGSRFAPGYHLFFLA